MFCSGKEFITLLYYTGTFLVGTHWLGLPFPTLQTFFGIFWVLPIDYSLYEKTVLEIFVYLFICEVKTTKVNFRFYEQYSQTAIRLIWERAIFAQNASIVFSSIIFFSSIHWKNPMEKFCKVKPTYTTFSLKFVFEKII